MSRLKQRIEKAKRLNFSNSSYTPEHWGTWGDKTGKDFGTKYYTVDLSKELTKVNTPDGQKTITLVEAKCQKNTGGPQFEDCPGNANGTVCYHSLGAIYRSFEQAKCKKLVSFFETYETALKMSFGGKVIKVKSAQGKGFVWATVKDWPEKNILSAQENINLMRGQEEEGID